MGNLIFSDRDDSDDSDHSDYQNLGMVILNSVDHSICLRNLGMVILNNADHQYYGDMDNGVSI